MSVIERLESKQGFTVAECELADYIIAHADDIAHMGIADLASAAYKSNATIIRVCRKTGVEGWRDFRIELAADLEKRRRAIPDADPNMPFEGKSSTATIMSSVLRLENAALADCYASVSPEAVGRLARAMCGARRIIFYALGDSYATTYAFGAYMSKIGIEVVAADQYRFRQEAAFHATPKDLALIVTYSGRYLNRLERQIARLHTQKCKIAIITSDSRVLSAVPAFDYPVLVPSRENRYGKVATFYSQTCIRYVLNCAYSVAFSQNYDNNLNYKNLIEEMDIDMLGGSCHI